jgi:hypothetical protein
MIRQVRSDMDRLRGRLFQLVELADLPPGEGRRVQRLHPHHEL